MYDEALAERLRAALDREVENVREQKMFGGLALMAGGHMVCGVIGDEMILRLGEEGADAALDEPHVRPMDFTGRPSRTMVYVEPPAFAEDAALEEWVRRGLAYVRTLPPRA